MNTEEFKEREERSLPYADPELRSAYLDMRRYCHKELFPILITYLKDSPVGCILHTANDFIKESSEMALMAFELCELQAKNPEHKDFEDSGKALVYEKFDRKMDDVANQHTKLCNFLCNIFYVTDDADEKETLRIGLKFLVTLQERSLETLNSIARTAERILGERDRNKEEMKNL